MIVRCGARRETAVLLTILTLATGCVRRATISQDYGLSGGIASQRTTRKRRRRISGHQPAGSATG